MRNAAHSAIQCTFNSLHCTYAMYNVHCTLHSVHCSLYLLTDHSTQHTVQWSLQTAQSSAVWRVKWSVPFCEERIWSSRPWPGLVTHCTWEEKHSALHCTARTLHTALDTQHTALHCTAHYTLQRLHLTLLYTSTLPMHCSAHNTLHFKCLDAVKCTEVHTEP